MALKEKAFTVADVARLLDLSDGRVRQVCRELEIGRIYGKTRILSADDLKKIEDREDRRKFNGRQPAS